MVLPKSMPSVEECHQMSGSANCLTQKAKITPVSRNMHIAGKEKARLSHGFVGATTACEVSSCFGSGTAGAALPLLSATTLGLIVVVEFGSG